jgi:hypothetical protein
MSALNRSALLILSTCALLAARSSERPAKPKNIFPNNGIASVLFSADLAQGHCVVNLSGDWSANYFSAAPVQNPQAHVNPEAHISEGSPEERHAFVLGKKVYKGVKIDDAETVATTRRDLYSDAYKDYQGKVIVVIVPTKGSAKAFKRRVEDGYKDSTLRELDELLTGFCDGHKR